jgi:hypothetical protein
LHGPNCGISCINQEQGQKTIRIKFSL